MSTSKCKKTAKGTFSLGFNLDLNIEAELVSLGVVLVK